MLVILESFDENFSNFSALFFTFSEKLPNFIANLQEFIQNRMHHFKTKIHPRLNPLAKPPSKNEHSTVAALPLSFAVECASKTTPNLSHDGRLEESRVVESSRRRVNELFRDTNPRRSELKTVE